MIHSAAISAFDQRTVIDHRIVEAEATGVAVHKQGDIFIFVRIDCFVKLLQKMEA